MPGLVNVGGSWKTVSNISVNVGGSWKAVNSAFVNISGVWKPWGGLPVTPSKGFIVGGYQDASGTKLNFVRKITFSSGTWSSGANSLSGTAQSNGVCNQYNGYAAADYNFTAIRKIIFSSETTSTISATWSGPNSGSGGISNTDVAGYFLPATRNQMTKFTFSNETASTISATTSANGNTASHFTNVGVAGYVVLGFNANTTVQKLALPAETISTLSSGLTVGRGITTGMSNVGTAGHVIGGRDPGATAVYNTWEYWSYPSDTRSSGSTGLFAAGGRATITEYQKIGYVCGGETNPNTSTVTNAVSRLTFSTNTWSTANSMNTNAASAVGLSESPGA